MIMIPSSPTEDTFHDFVEYGKDRYGLVKIDCIRPGMWHDERCVELVDTEGKRHAGFFPEQTILEDRLAVFLFGENLAGNNLLVTPSTHSGGYGFFSSSSLWVSKERVMELSEQEFEKRVYKIERIRDD